jgi:hypothetical protein
MGKITNNTKCKVHGVNHKEWFESKVAKAGICPKCIEAGFYIKKIEDEYNEFKRSSFPLNP